MHITGQSRWRLVVCMFLTFAGWEEDILFILKSYIRYSVSESVAKQLLSQEIWLSRWCRPDSTKWAVLCNSPKFYRYRNFAVPTSSRIKINHFPDIYSHASKDHKPFLKSTFYEHPQPEPGVVAERDPEKHRDSRKLLSHGFSAKALKDQESILQEYTDLFISQIGKFGTGIGGLNMKQVSISQIMIKSWTQLIKAVVQLA